MSTLPTDPHALPIPYDMNCLTNPDEYDVVRIAHCEPVASHVEPTDPGPRESIALPGSSVRLQPAASPDGADVLRVSVSKGLHYFFAVRRKAESAGQSVKSGVGSAGSAAEKGAAAVGRMVRESRKPAKLVACLPLASVLPAHTYKIDKASDICFNHAHKVQIFRRFDAHLAKLQKLLSSQHPTAIHLADAGAVGLLILIVARYLGADWPWLQKTIDIINAVLPVFNCIIPYAATGCVALGFSHIFAALSLPSLYRMARYACLRESGRAEYKKRWDTSADYWCDTVAIPWQTLETALSATIKTALSVLPNGGPLYYLLTWPVTTSILIVSWPIKYGIGWPLRWFGGAVSGMLFPRSDVCYRVWDEPSPAPMLVDDSEEEKD